jgi:hypothetical protein
MATCGPFEVERAKALAYAEDRTARDKLPVDRNTYAAGRTPDPLTKAP